MLHVIGFGRALGAHDRRSRQLPVRVLEPEPARAHAADGLQLLLARRRRCPNQPTLFGPEFQLYPPALAIQRANFIYGILTGQYGSAYAIDRTPSSPRWRRNPAALVDLVNQRLMMGRMSSQLRSLLITATSAVPAVRPESAGHRRALPRGDLERVLGLRRRLQRRRRDPEHGAAADRASPSGDQYGNIDDAALEPARARARAPTATCSKAASRPAPCWPRCPPAAPAAHLHLRRAQRLVLPAPARDERRRS